MVDMKEFVFCPQETHEVEVDREYWQLVKDMMTPVEGANPESSAVTTDERSELWKKEKH